MQEMASSQQRQWLRVYQLLKLRQHKYGISIKLLISRVLLIILMVCRLDTLSVTV